MTTNQNQPMQPQQVHQTVIVMGKQKSAGLAFLLTFLFGPIGLLYASVSGGIIMIVLGVIIGIVTLGFGLIVVWIISMIWAVVSANNANNKPMAQHFTAPQPIQQQPHPTAQPIASEISHAPQTESTKGNQHTPQQPQQSTIDIDGISSWFALRKKQILIVAGSLAGILLLTTLATYIVNSGIGKQNGTSDTPAASQGTNMSGSTSGSTTPSTPVLDDDMMKNDVVIDTYIGTLGNKEFKLFIETVNGDVVEGYNVTGSNRRPVRGRIVNKSKKPTGFGGEYTIFRVILNEPGDHEWDGEFNIDLWLSDLTRHGTGSWRSFNGKLNREIKIIDRYNN